MVDITAKLFWYRIKEWCGIMADKLDGVVYTDDTKKTVDIVNLSLFVCILLVLIAYIVGTLTVKYFRKRKTSFGATEYLNTVTEPLITEEHLSNAEKYTITTKEDTNQDLISLEIPKCEGDDFEIVDWINKIFEWIYNQKVVSPIIDSWLSALNARTRLLSTEHGILVDFKDILCSKHPPNISEVYQHPSSKYDTLLSFDVEVENIIFEVLITQFKEKNKIQIPYHLKLKRLCGHINTKCTSEDLSFISKHSETPQILLTVEQCESKETFPDDNERLRKLICEIGTEALSSTIVNLRLNCFPDCPRLQNDTFLSQNLVESIVDENEKKLLVKIIKASNLGDDILSPYCVVEMDDPPQRFETQVPENTKNPFWDESFTFTVKNASAELLFEIYNKDAKGDTFAGLGIVSVEELLSNPSQRQIIPLQSRPLEEDDVTGALTAEFLFLDQTVPVTEVTQFAKSNQPFNESSGKRVETNSRVTAGGTVITTTTIKRTKEDGQTDISRTALKELEKLSTSPGPPSKSTLIIHSVQRPDNSISESLEASPASRHSKDSHTSDSIPSSPTLERNGERSRSKEKKSFMGNLRRRLSFRKTRSKSAENRVESESNYSRTSSRSASTDRLRQSPAHRLSPFKGKLGSSTRSSLSEASGISASSTRTYVHENSTLVIEINENGILRRYLIPHSLVNRSKWKKRGTKLHIFNDHVFVAKHLSGSTSCQVCKKYLTRRPGKQGYECRGCNLQCHKSCHVKVEDFCSNSSINSMEVEYVQDSKTGTPKTS